MGNFLSQEGLASRIVPVKGGDQVNTELMYRNMMTKFKFGGIENPKVYIDENKLRFTTSLRRQFGVLADALIAEGKRDSALAVLDYCQEKVPAKTVNHNYGSFGLMESYYNLAYQYTNQYTKLSELKQSGKMDTLINSIKDSADELKNKAEHARQEGDAIWNALYTTSSQYLAWLNALDSSKLRSATSDFAHHFRIYRALLSLKSEDGKLNPEDAGMYGKYSETAKRLGLIR